MHVSDFSLFIRAMGSQRRILGSEMLNWTMFGKDASGFGVEEIGGRVK